MTKQQNNEHDTIDNILVRVKQQNGLLQLNNNKFNELQHAINLLHYYIDVSTPLQ